MLTYSTGCIQNLPLSPIRSQFLAFWYCLVGSLEDKKYDNNINCDDTERKKHLVHLIHFGNILHILNVLIPYILNVGLSPPVKLRIGWSAGRSAVFDESVWRDLTHAKV